MSAVCTDEQVESHRNLGCPFLIMPERIALNRILGMVSLFSMVVLLKPSGSLIEISACQFVIEVQRDVRELFKGIEKTLVEARSVHCLDVLGKISVEFDGAIGLEDLLCRLHHTLEIPDKVRHSSSAHESCERAWV